MDAKVYELLVKTANRLDELELFDEARAIDKYLKINKKQIDWGDMVEGIAANSGADVFRIDSGPLKGVYFPKWRHFDMMKDRKTLTNHRTRENFPIEAFTDQAVIPGWISDEDEYDEYDEYDIYANDPLAKMVSLANALDCSGDEQLQKYASVLDEIMLTIGAPRGSNHEFESKAEAEIEKLRDKYREEGREEVYKERRKKLDEQNGKEATTKAFADQVKKYKPLEMPLSTRYCPDHPGGMLVRVGDHVYQCEMDKKMYNYQAGFTTNKGNVIPGGGVERQIKDWGDRDLGHAMFDTRQTVMSRFASDESNSNYEKCNCENLNCNHFDGKWEPCKNNANYDGGKVMYIGNVCGQCYVEYPKEYRLSNDELFDVEYPKVNDDEPFDISDVNDLPQFTYGFHMLDGRKVILVKSDVKLNDQQRTEIIKKIQGPMGTIYEIVFEQDILG